MVSGSEKTIRVVVVDDHTLFAEGTVALLSSEPYISVVGTAKNGRDCLKIVKTEYPDVVLLDINLPDFCGTDLIEKIKELASNVSIIMLTGQNPEEYVNDSLNKGAHGFLLKDCSKTEMTTAIIQASSGKYYFSQNMAQYLRSVIVGEEISTNIIEAEKIHGTSLTPKEIEIIDLIAQGLRNREIAATLGIKNRTVDFHVSNILSKLGVKSRLEAVLIYTKDKMESAKIS
ncbi:response regulator transcription factor [Desulfosporosinus sp. BICA1-9]|uniref:response regulator n=1 Tax=Desulfosporosinus sp. BICA1-9 TaxID=1531958 RepID=UPI00054BFEF7|nr:response regulator transcription factor [Desulfosporosinus sp. BICA1-9]KJS46033.1 MAG: histidine kinase [Peptococcaceae bacterium BRH_c23]KJS87999.1 MAG: histidine kinase [Desulfosporosinus sp. BICA1-9]HBW37317.1 DNA-binding response regulator [Desulfosporosinus sp.]